MNIVKSAKLDFHVLFETYLELQVQLCCNSSCYRDYTSQAFYPYIVGITIHPDERNQYI
jgi:hypothetical protein